MRDPYKPRRDYSRIGLIVIGALSLVAVLLLGVIVFKPGPSATETRSERALEAQMDQSEARYEARREAAEAARAQSME